MVSGTGPVDLQWPAENMLFTPIASVHSCADCPSSPSQQSARRMASAVTRPIADLNADGQVTKKEALDVNADGKVSHKEFALLDADRVRLPTPHPTTAEPLPAT